MPTMSSLRSDGPAPPPAAVAARGMVPARFALVGVANTLLDVAVFAALAQLAGLAPVTANLIYYSCGIAACFTVNRSWTFRDSRSRPLAQQLGLFVAVNLGGLALSSAVVWAATPAIGLAAAKGAAILVTFAWNFALNRMVVFPKA